MKLHSFGVLFMIAGCFVSVLGQGVVKVENNFVRPGEDAKAFVRYDFGSIVTRNRGRVEVVDQTGAVISGVKDGTGDYFGADGLFFLGELVVPGSTPGGSAVLVIRSWDVESGSTFESAWVKDSVQVTVTGLGGGVIPVPKLGDVSNFAGLRLQGAKITSVNAGAENWSIRVNILPGVGYNLSISDDLTHWTKLDGPTSLPLDYEPPFPESVPPPFHVYGWDFLYRNLPDWMTPAEGGTHYFRVTTAGSP